VNKLFFFLKKRNKKRARGGGSTEQLNDRFARIDAWRRKEEEEREGGRRRHFTHLVLTGKAPVLNKYGRCSLNRIGKEPGYIMAGWKDTRDCDMESSRRTYLRDINEDKIVWEFPWDS
jgi:hypothetical protein